MLDTVFAQPASGQGALDGVWMQIVDLLAQNQTKIAPDRRNIAFEKLSQIRDQVSVKARIQSSISVAGFDPGEDIVSFFGKDIPAVAAPVLLGAQLSRDSWQRIIAQLPPPSRALLRERRDLPDGVARMLASFGPSDFALPDVGSEQGQGVDDGNQIRDLVARIEAFRREREIEADLRPAIASSLQQPATFRFQTGIDGIILWVDGAHPGPIIGIDISALAEAGEHGVDGNAAGAFRKRSPFQNARMIVPGAGVSAGAWLITGLPSFNDASGRFLGYRVVARRPASGEQALLSQSPVFGSGMSADSVRQLVHELRTPLNAICGFAEMIGGQLLGPVAIGYRDRATKIIEDSKRLLGLFDDLETVAKLEGNRLEPRDPDRADIASIVTRIATGIGHELKVRNVLLDIYGAGGNHLASISGLTAERMIGRLITMLAGLAGSGESLAINLAGSGDTIALKIDLPQCLKGKSEADILDPAFRPEAQWQDAPVLGLGFALRLIDSMARSVKSKFTIGADQFELIMPSLSLRNGDADQA